MIEVSGQVECEVLPCGGEGDDVIKVKSIILPAIVRFLSSELIVLMFLGNAYIGWVRGEGECIDYHHPPEPNPDRNGTISK